MNNLMINKMKSKLIITLMLSFGIMSISASDYGGNQDNLNGTYYDEKGETGLIISGDFMSIYVSSKVFSIPLTLSYNLMNRCHIKYEGSNIYNIDSVVELDESALKDITIKQDDKLPMRPRHANTSDDDDDEDEESDNVNYERSDSVRVDFIFPYMEDYKHDILSVQGMYLITDELTDNFYAQKRIDSDTVTIYIPPTTELFEFSIDIANPMSFSGENTKWYHIESDDMIPATKKYIEITLPYYARYQRNLYSIVDEYFKVLYPGVIRWRGQLFYKFDNSEDYSKYILKR